MWMALDSLDAETLPARLRGGLELLCLSRSSGNDLGQANASAIDVRAIERLMAFASRLDPVSEARLMAFGREVLIVRRKQFEVAKARQSELRTRPGHAPISLPRVSIMAPA
jgi:hypothetical protein